MDEEQQENTQAEQDKSKPRHLLVIICSIAAVLAAVLVFLTISGNEGEGEAGPDGKWGRVSKRGKSTLWGTDDGARPGRGKKRRRSPARSGGQSPEDGYAHPDEGTHAEPSDSGASPGVITPAGTSPDTGGQGQEGTRAGMPSEPAPGDEEKTPQSSSAPDKPATPAKPEITVHTELREGFSTSLRAGKKLLVVWVLDSSLSMLDDYKEMKEKISEFYRLEDLKSADDLRMAVIAFSHNAYILLRPTSDMEKIKKAFDSVPPGTGEEFPMAAIAASVESLTDWGSRERILVLMTDERGLDEDRCESVGKLLKRKRVKFFSMTPQSRFLVESRHVVSSDPRYSVSCEEVGLEDVIKARITSWAVSPLTPVKQNHNFPGLAARGRNLFLPYLEIPSGTSWYAFEHLAKVTGGKCFYLEEKTGYKKESLAPYLPIYDSYKSALEKAQKSLSVRAVRALIAAWRKIYVGPLFVILPREASLTAKTEADQYRDLCERGIKDMLAAREKISARLQEGRIEEDSEPRRWRADLDLVIAQLRVASFHLGQYSFALKEWWEKGRKQFACVYMRPIPALHTTAETTASGTIRGGEAEREAFTKAHKELDRVVGRHPGTPWAKTALALKNMWTMEIQEFDPTFTGSSGGGGVPKPPGKQ